MSRNLNNIFIFTGNMAKDIEAKYTEDGLCITNFVVAENALKIKKGASSS